MPETGSEEQWRRRDAYATQIRSERDRLREAGDHEAASALTLQYAKLYKWLRANRPSRAA